MPGFFDRRSNITVEIGWVMGANSVSAYKVAVAGLSHCGLHYLDVLRQSERFEILAVADTNPAIVRGLDIQESHRVYEDYRSLVVETAQAGLDLLLVATEPFVSRDMVRMAADRGVAVFHASPFARTVREGAEIIRRFEDAGVPFATGGTCCQDARAQDAKHLAEKAGHVYTAIVDVQTADGHDGWRGDSHVSGGGVLLHGAYDQLDLLVTLMGVPESVIAVCGFARSPGAAISYDTEDYAQLLIRWSDNRSATVSIRRGRPTDEWSFIIVGTEETLVWTGPSHGVTGGGDDEPSGDRHLASRFEATIALRSSEEPRRSDAHRHLSTLAVVEAAYLSARTGTPETPARFLE